MWPSREDDLSVDYDPEWYAKYEAEQKRRYRERVITTAGYGYLFGQVVGTSAFVLQTRRAGPQALGAGVALGVCMSVGFLLRSL